MPYISDVLSRDYANLEAHQQIFVQYWVSCLGLFPLVQSYRPVLFASQLKLNSHWLTLLLILFYRVQLQSDQCLGKSCLQHIFYLASSYCLRLRRERSYLVFVIISHSRHLFYHHWRYHHDVAYDLKRK